MHRELNMFRSKIVYFLSEIDKMLQKFNETHEKSEAQLAEIRKYEDIYKKRDQKEQD